MYDILGFLNFFLLIVFNVIDIFIFLSVMNKWFLIHLSDYRKII